MRSLGQALMQYDGGTREGKIHVKTESEREHLGQSIRGGAALPLWFLTFGLQNYEIIQFYCFKPLGLCYHLRANPGNEYIR